MDPTDLLRLAAQAAQAIRMAGDLDSGLTAGYTFLDQNPPRDKKDDPAVRIARLVCAAGERRADLLQHLWSLPHGGALLLNRPDEEPNEDLAEPDAEAERLYKIVNSSKHKRLDMMEDGFPSFSIVRREVGGTFGGRWVSGKGGVMRYKSDNLPESVRGLIDYPLEVPVVFPINAGSEPWSIWDICCAFAEQYVRVYEHPHRYGVWGHDIGDLWIEGLEYFPKEKLIYAHIGS
jgi:hypothetical protein